MSKLLLLSRYGRLGASSRARFLQYLPYLTERGIQVEVSPLFFDNYLQKKYSGSTFPCLEVGRGYFRRFLNLLEVRKFDGLVIQTELFPFLPALFERWLTFQRIPWVVDYDDAWFHRYDQHELRVVRQFLGNKIDSVMRCANVVIAGNEYIANRAWTAGAKRVEVIPTVVDTEKYIPIFFKHLHRDGIPVIGWIGSPATEKYLEDLLPVFEKLKCQRPLKIRAVGASARRFDGTIVEVIPWQEETEIAAIQSFDIGIMPLPDAPWERGKCGYKLIQYMACGLPVVASPVGVNCQLVRCGENGFLATTLDEWFESLSRLIDNPSLRWQMGQSGRQQVECQYSLKIYRERLANLLLEFMSL